MQCEVSFVKGQNYICGNNVPHGSLAVDESGNVFYRTMFALSCLNSHGLSYTGERNPCPANKLVRVLPVGSVVTLTQK